jgi:Na+-translocating ferredoxin:NAD+ oxidoreductase RnfC subunit
MALLDKIFDAGIVGTGGAGFPTHMKLNCKVEYFLVNAAECEPLLHTDKYLMKHRAADVLCAIEAVAQHVEAKEVFIGVKAVNTEEIACLKKAIQEKSSKVKIFELDNYYPAGDEQMLVFDITGRVVPPGGIPLKVGCVVSNYDTMLTIFDAMNGNPFTHKYLTVAGEVASPAVLRVPIGISFAECIAACGGATIKDFKLINGGPMMGKIIPGADSGKSYVTKTTSGIIVIPAGNNFDARVSETPVRHTLNCAKSACIQCRICSDLCPRQLIGHKLRPNRIMRKMAMLDFEKELIPDDTLREALICCECGICETFACPMGLSPRQVNKYVKSVLKGERPPAEPVLYPVSDLREYRKIAPKKIMARMGLLGLYENKASAFCELGAARVHIPCSQHIGAPAEPLVMVGESVQCGQLIAKAVEGKPSANIHASISGTVVSIGALIEIEGGK